MADDLFSLLPAFDQLEDAGLGGPLRALLAVIGDQAAVLEADIARLYDDWFIETCQDWLVPYFADLVDVTLGPAVGASATGTLDPLDSASRRSQVANAIRDRRAKGTLAAIERFAADTAGWPCRAIEYAWLLSITQSLLHPDLRRGTTMAIGDANVLDALGTPFSAAAKTADVRRISSHRTRGTHNVPSLGLVAWRLTADGVDRAPAECVNDDNHFTFDVLGRDTQLCVRPTPRIPGQPPASDLDVPAPISRIALDRRLEDYYGEAASFCIYRGRTPVDRADTVVADLGRWRYRLAPRQVAVDPVLGRIAFPVRDVPEEGVRVSYRRLTVGGLGGGQYPRSLAPPAGALYPVSMTGQGGHASVSAAFAAWRSDQAAGKASSHATIEILDDGVYEERLHLELRPGEVLEIRAADGHRPVLRPAGEDDGDRPEALRVVGLRREEERPADPEIPPHRWPPPGGSERSRARTRRDRHTVGCRGGAGQPAARHRRPARQRAPGGDGPATWPAPGRHLRRGVGRPAPGRARRPPGHCHVPALHPRAVRGEPARGRPHQPAHRGHALHRPDRVRGGRPDAGDQPRDWFRPGSAVGIRLRPGLRPRRARRPSRARSGGRPGRRCRCTG